MQPVNVSSVRKAVNEAKFDPREPKIKATIDIATPDYFRIAAMEKINESMLATDNVTRLWTLNKAIQFLILAIIGYGRSEEEA